MYYYLGGGFFYKISGFIVVFNGIGVFVGLCYLNMFFFFIICNIYEICWNENIMSIVCIKILN